MNSFNPELQLKNTEFAIKHELKNMLNKLRDFKFVRALVLKLKKKTKTNKDETKYSIWYSNSKAETTIHNTDIDNVFEVFEATYSTIMTKI